MGAMLVRQQTFVPPALRRAAPVVVPAASMLCASPAFADEIGDAAKTLSKAAYPFMKEVPWNSNLYNVKPGSADAVSWAKAIGKMIDMGAAMDSQPAHSLQSGPQSASIYAGSASIPPPSGLTASQQMVVASGAVASQPHQSSVPTGQHSVSQVSAGGGGQTSAPMLEVNPLTSEMLQDAKPAEKKRLIGERLFPKIQVA